MAQGALDIAYDLEILSREFQKYYLLISHKFRKSPFYTTILFIFGLGKHHEEEDF